MRSVVLALLFPATALAAPTVEALQSASTSWEHLTTKKHDIGPIDVFKTELDGISCFKGVANTDVAIPKLLEVVTDIESTSEWSTAGITHDEVFARQGDQLYFYEYLDTPGWTFSADRHWFLHGTIRRSGDEVAFTWDRIPEGSPYQARITELREANPKAIEPPVNIGAWHFKPAEGGTQVIYFVCTDVGGTIPQGIQNAATKGTLPDTVGDVVVEAKKR